MFSVCKLAKTGINPLCFKMASAALLPDRQPRLGVRLLYLRVCGAFDKDWVPIIDERPDSL